MPEPAPLWICFVPQLASVLGDSFGQRSSRVFHGGNRRRFIVGLISVSSVQMFVVLSVIQLALPSTTTVIYEKVNGTNVDFCARHPSDENCYAQGPLTIYRAVQLCPALLANGLLNIVYYLGEASMYRQPLGVLMLVLAALASSFLIAPMQNWFHLDGATPVSVWAILLGIAGSLCCLAERSPPASGSAVVFHHRDDEDEADRPVQSSASMRIQGLQDDDDDLPIEVRGGLIVHAKTPLTPGRSPTRGGGALGRCWDSTQHLLPLLAPFLLLSFAYALYFVMMLYYNDNCKVNMWGYNGYDQVTLPLYMFALFFIVDAVAPCQKTIRWDERQEESMWEAIKATWRELFAKRGAGFWNMFVYRLLINARAIAYTYITVTFDLSSSYLQLTLIRVVLSWIASLVLVLVVPAFIRSEVHEQQKLKDWVNLTLKVIGTFAIVGALFIIHYQ